MSLFTVRDSTSSKRSAMWGCASPNVFFCYLLARQAIANLDFQTQTLQTQTLQTQTLQSQTLQSQTLLTQTLLTYTLLSINKGLSLTFKGCKLISIRQQVSFFKSFVITKMKTLFLCVCVCVCVILLLLPLDKCQLVFRWNSSILDLNEKQI